MESRHVSFDMRHVAGALPFDVWVRDSEGTCVYANPAASRRWPGLVGSTARSLEQLDERWGDAHDRALAGEVVRTEGKDALHVTAPIVDDDEITGTVGIRIDSATRGCADESAQVSNELLSMLCDLAPALIGIRAVSGDDIIHVYDNQHAASLFGRTPEQLRGRTESELGVDPNMVSRARDHFRRSLEQRRAPFEIVIPTPRGSRIISGVVAPIDWPDTSRETYAVVGQDVTELRALEAKALLADRIGALGTVIDTLGHELANPAQIAILELERVEAMLTDPPQPDRERAREALRSAIQGVQQMMAVAEDVRTLLRGREHTVDRVDINRIVEATTHLVRSDKATVSLELERVPSIQGRRVQLAQVMINLLKNAFEAFAEDTTGNQVLLRTKRDGDFVVVTIEDDGPGLAATLTDEGVFAPFVTTKADVGGTGLGLHLCRHIVEQHGGTIHHEHTDGGGARFVIRLPVADTQPGAPPLVS